MATITAVQVESKLHPGTFATYYTVNGGDYLHVTRERAEEHAVLVDASDVMCDVQALPDTREEHTMQETQCPNDGCWNDLVTDQVTCIHCERHGPPIALAPCEFCGHLFATTPVEIVAGIAICDGCIDATRTAEASHATAA
jgi:hypothetical protein